MIDYQDLEDRIASLERITRNIGIGQELTVGSLRALDKVTAAEVIEKKPRYDIRAFGAVGDGSTRDDLRIQAAIDAANGEGAGIVFVPPGDYKIQAPLRLKPGVNIQGCGHFSRLLAADMAYPILETTATTGMWQWCWIRGIRLEYDKPGDTSTWVSKPPAGDARGAKAINLPSNAREYLIENVTIHNGYAGIWDEISFGGEVRHVRTNRCQFGYFKHNAATTTRLINFFASGTADDGNLGDAWDIRAIHVKNGYDFASHGCAVNEYDVNTVVPHLNFNSGSTVFSRGETITGATSGATGVVEFWYVDSGTWGGGDAAGTLYLANVSGTFQAEDLNGSTGGNNIASSTGAAVGYKAALAFEDLEDFQLAQLNLESNVTHENGAVVRIHNIKGFTVNGIWEWDDTLGTGTGFSEALVVRNNSVGAINGVKLGGALVTATGTGIAYILRIMDGCFVTVNSGSFKDPAGSGMTKWGIAKTGAGGSVVVIASEYDSWDDAGDDMCEITGADGVGKTGAE